MTINFSTLSDDALSELLLDYVQGRASEETIAVLKTRLVTDEKLADELAYYQGLQQAVSAQKQDRVPDEIGWKRLTNAIEAERKPVAANDNGRFWKYAAAALAVVAALQTAVIVQTPATDDDPVYVTASSDDKARFGLNVIFQPDSSTSDMTEVLRALDGDMVAGPSALGLYTVAFETEAARDAALNALSGQTELIENVTQN